MVCVCVCANKFISFAISRRRRWVTDRDSITVDNANWPSWRAKKLPRHFSHHLASCLRWQVRVEKKAHKTLTVWQIVYVNGSASGWTWRAGIGRYHKIAKEICAEPKSLGILAEWHVFPYSLPDSPVIQLAGIHFTLAESKHLIYCLCAL